MFYTERLMLRSLDANADAKQISHWLNDTEYLLAMQADAPKPVSSVSGKKFCEERIKAAEESGLPVLAICLRPETAVGDNVASHEDLFVDKEGVARNPMIGLLVFHAARRMSFTNRCCSFGLLFERPYTGKGYGTELLRWATRYVFDSLGLHRFELTVRTDNAAAIRCYEKIGFVREGVHRDLFFYDGEWRDTSTMALLEPEWRAQQQKKQ